MFFLVFWRALQGFSWQLVQVPAILILEAPICSIVLPLPYLVVLVCWEAWVLYGEHLPVVSYWRCSLIFSIFLVLSLTGSGSFAELSLFWQLPLIQWWMSVKMELPRL